MKQSHINHLNEYLTKLTPKSHQWAKELEHYAKEHRIPIMDSVSMNFMLQLIRLQRPKRILEIGTAIGYSALRMHDILQDSKIITIEKNEKMYQLARENVENFAKNNNITIIHGDALEIVNGFNNNEQFDFVFIDAAKKQYELFFEAVDRYVTKNGIIVLDNVLFRHLVVSHDDDVPKRLIKIAEKLAQFNEKVMKDTNYHSSVIPIGDGLLISIKIK